MARDINNLSETSLTILLSDMYEAGYHVGLIYGGWQEQDVDRSYAKQFTDEPVQHSGCPCGDNMHDPYEGMMNYGGSDEE